MQQAIELYKQAARGGYGKAAFRLGEIYEKGLGGVSANKQEALRWYNAARVLGHPPAVGDFPSPPR
jgi:TPR repeat protein